MLLVLIMLKHGVLILGFLILSAYHCQRDRRRQQKNSKST